jgi:hypothetical protein
MRGRVVQAYIPVPPTTDNFAVFYYNSSDRYFLLVTGTLCQQQGLFHPGLVFFTKGNVSLDSHWIPPHDVVINFLSVKFFINYLSRPY